MIETRDLQCAYPLGPALHFPDVHVAQGSVMVMRGRSGSGKSSWLALAAGLLSASGGEIIVAGQSMAELHGAARDAWRARAIGFLPQKLHLSEALTVAGNLSLAYFAAGLKPDDDAIASTLATLGVDSLAARRPSQLSGGQAQRVALARAVLLKPQVILADEPTASLDDHSAHTALALLQECAERCEATLVIATHDRRVDQSVPVALWYQVGPDAQPSGSGRL